MCTSVCMFAQGLHKRWVLYVCTACARERFFSHGSSSVRRKYSSQDMKKKKKKPWQLFITCLQTANQAETHIWHWVWWTRRRVGQVGMVMRGRGVRKAKGCPGGRTRRVSVLSGQIELSHLDDTRINKIHFRKEFIILFSKHNFPNYHWMCLSLFHWHYSDC